MAMPNWREVERWTPSLADEPTVGIQGSGNLSFNQAAVKLLGFPKAIKILYDPDERLVGFKAADSSLGAFPIHKQSKSTTYLVSGKALVDTMHLQIGEARRYVARMEDNV